MLVCAMLANGRGPSEGIPAVTDPPGELMYRLMGLSGLSASRNSNCATIDAETVSSTWPFRQTMRSLRSRENMSSSMSFDCQHPFHIFQFQTKSRGIVRLHVCQPPPYIVSTPVLLFACRAQAYHSLSHIWRRRPSSRRRWLLLLLQLPYWIRCRSAREGPRCTSKYCVRTLP